MHLSPFSVRLWLAKDIKHTWQAFIVQGRCPAVHHYVIQVDDYSRDACKDGGHHFLEVSGDGAKTKWHADVAKNPSVGHKSCNVAAACMQRKCKPGMHPPTRLRLTPAASAAHWSHRQAGQGAGAARAG